MKAIISFAFFTLFLSVYASAEDFKVITNEERTVKQGETFVIELGEDFKSKDVALYIFDQTYFFNSSGKSFVGVDFKQEPGNYSAYLVNKNTYGMTGFYSKFIKVVENTFPERELPPVRKINLTPKQKRKLEQKKRKETRQTLIEENILATVYNSGEKNESFLDGKFRMPLNMIFKTDEFGVKRMRNGELVSRHSGVDLRAKIGTLVMAVNSGRVALVTKRKFVLEGKMVIIDHGLGIFSVYMHLSKIKVKKGQMVKAGDVVGLSGNTGKNVTGPHLHFMIKIGRRAVVSPFDFLETANKYLE